jgi:hypothetical protein
MVGNVTEQRLETFVLANQDLLGSTVKIMKVSRFKEVAVFTLVPDFVPFTQVLIGFSKR